MVAAMWLTAVKVQVLGWVNALLDYWVDVFDFDPEGVGTYVSDEDW
jgi:hypothetical protein